MIMHGCANPIRAWNRFWFAPVSARPLGVFRIVFGLIVLLHLLLLAPDALLWLSDTGYLQGDEARQLAGPLRWSPLQMRQDPAAVQLALALTALAAVGFTLGFHTRLCAVAQYAGLLTIHHRNILTISGADALLMITAFWMMLAPSGAAFSLDARRRPRDREPLIAPWAQRMMQLQLCLVYFMTAFEKTRGASWADGTALYWVLSNLEIRRWTFGLTQNLPLINALTFAALLLEFALAFLLWFRPTRPFTAIGGVVLHVGIWFTVNIPIFGELMMATYLLFFTPQELTALARAFAPWTWRKTRRLAQSHPHRPNFTRHEHQGSRASDVESSQTDGTHAAVRPSASQPRAR